MKNLLIIKANGNVGEINLCKNDVGRGEGAGKPLQKGVDCRREAPSVGYLSASAGQCGTNEVPL